MTKHFIEEYYNSLIEPYAKAGVDMPKWLAEKEPAPDPDITVKDDKLNMTLNGPIDSFMGVDTKDYINALNENPDLDVDLKITTSGGSYFDAMALYGALREHKGEVTTTASGLAASGGVFLLLAGDKRYIQEGTTLMAHGAQSMFIHFGSEKSFNEQSAEHSEVLATLNSNVRDLFSERLEISEEEAQAYVEKDTWLTANESREAGFGTKPEDKGAEPEAKTELPALSKEDYNKILAALKQKWS